MDWWHPRSKLACSCQNYVNGGKILQIERIWMILRKCSKYGKIASHSNLKHCWNPNNKILQKYASFSVFQVSGADTTFEFFRKTSPWRQFTFWVSLRCWNFPCVIFVISLFFLSLTVTVVDQCRGPPIFRIFFFRWTTSNNNPITFCAFCWNCENIGLVFHGNAIFKNEPLMVSNQVDVS